MKRCERASSYLEASQRPLSELGVRGEAYQAAHHGSEAAGGFQKILNHRGIVRKRTHRALAYLQLGRAYTMLGDTAKAKAAYQDFPHASERRRPRCSHLRRRQVRVREAAVILSEIVRRNFV